MAGMFGTPTKTGGRGGRPVVPGAAAPAGGPSLMGMLDPLDKSGQGRVLAATALPGDPLKFTLYAGLGGLSR